MSQKDFENGVIVGLTAKGKAFDFIRQVVDIEYTDVIYNDDDTITLIEKDGTEHVVTCIYDDNKMVGVSYDGNTINVAYEDDVLVGIGDTTIDMSGVPGSNGAALNIAYGDIAPEDTSKLWIKTNEPQSIKFSKDFVGVDGINLEGNLSEQLQSMGCVRIDNKIYLLGGLHDYSNYRNSISVFNLTTKELSTLDVKLPSQCGYAGCVVHNKKIYIFGGKSSNNYPYKTIFVFNTEDLSVTTLETTLPEICSHMACAIVGTKVYLFGGNKRNASGNDMSTINMFDIETETITTLTPKLSSARGSMGCAVVGTKIYLFGGRPVSTTSNRLDKIEVFDTETQTISTLDVKLPQVNCEITCVAIGSKIYLFGGNGGAYNTTTPLNVIYVFDTETQTFTTLDTVLPTGTYSMGAINVGNDIYLFGGNGMSTINKFSLTHDLAQNNIEIITAYKNFFNIVNTDTMQVEIGVDSVLIGNADNQAENCEAYLYKNEQWTQI